MREFGKIHTRYWSWAQAHNLTDQVKLIGAYLLSCEHGNSLGCFRLPRSYIAEDLGYSVDIVSTSCRHLEKLGFLEYCETSKFVLIKKYLKWNPPKNESHAQGILSMVSQIIPSSFTLLESLMESLRRYGGKHLKRQDVDTLYHTLSPMVSTQCPQSVETKETETEIEKEIEIETKKEKEIEKENMRAAPADPPHPKNSKKSEGEKFHFKVKVPLPKNFYPTSEMKAYAKRYHMPEEEVPFQFEKFKAHHQKLESKFNDWIAAWRNWVLKWVEFNKPTSGPPLQEPVQSSRCKGCGATNVMIDLETGLCAKCFRAVAAPDLAGLVDKATKGMDMSEEERLQQLKKQSEQLKSKEVPYA